MGKFIELTDPDNGNKVVFNTSFLLSVHCLDDGKALLQVAHSGVVQELLCLEDYTTIKGLLVNAH